MPPLNAPSPITGTTSKSSWRRSLAIAIPSAPDSDVLECPAPRHHARFHYVSETLLILYIDVRLEIVKHDRLIFYVHMTDAQHQTEIYPVELKKHSAWRHLIPQFQDC